MCDTFSHDLLPRALKEKLKLNQFALQTTSNLPIRHKTLITYRSMYRCHIEKVIGELDLAEVKRTHIQELIAPLPPQTSQMTLAVLEYIS